MISSSLSLLSLIALTAMLLHRIGAAKTFQQAKIKFGCPSIRYSNGMKLLTKLHMSSTGDQHNNNQLSDHEKSTSSVTSSSSSSSHKGFGSKYPVIDPNRFKSDPKIVVPDLANVIKESSFQKLVEDYQAVPASDGAPTTSNATGRRVFDDALKFPCEFKLKIIGVNDETFVNDVLSSIAAIIGVSADKLSYSVRESASSSRSGTGDKVSSAESGTTGGKYISLTIKTVYSSADQLYAAYDIAKLDQRIKYVM